MVLSAWFSGQGSTINDDANLGTGQHQKLLPYAGQLVVELLAAGKGERDQLGPTCQAARSKQLPIDRMYCNLYVPQLQRVEGLLAFIHGHLGKSIASTLVIAQRSRDFIARLAAIAGAHGIPRVDFARGQRKDDVMHEYLAAFEAAGRTEGVLFIGRAQEKNTVFRTEKRRAADGSSYPWIVRTTSVVNQFYVHCVDEDFEAFFLKFSSYFPYGPSCWSTDTVGLTLTRFA
jgi:hypothetical protein